MRVVTVLMVALAVVLAAAAAASARTWCILPDGSGDAPTIQAGIDSAVAGDSVLLAAGTYTGGGNKGINFLGKAITVTSESGREVTIIDFEGSGRGFVFQSGEGSSSVLSGVTIRNGIANNGGGIYCDGSSPTISGNTIRDNWVIYVGGGGIACCNYSSPVISDNIISGNSASESGGAGIYCDEYSSPTISGNTISGNWADSVFGVGGGICCGGSSPTISGNIISGNGANVGGGIYCDGSSPTISGNTISGNWAYARGGGIWCGWGAPVISNTIIAFSTQGEGISCEGGNPTLTCCDIYGNAGGDSLCGIDGGGNFSLDPLFCLRWPGDYCLDYSSPCAPGNHPSGCGLIGAAGVGCDQPTRIQPTTWGRIKSMFR